MPSRLDPPDDIAAILRELTSALNYRDPDSGGKIGDAKFGVYAFFDYDEEPIYVGRTNERLRTRIRRHLTNQRTDAVAMNVLDPFEVLDVEMWPYWDLAAATSKQAAATLASAEYTVYRAMLEASAFGAVLNEKPPDVAPIVELPKSFRWRIVPRDVYERRRHPDIRIAQRAATIARLADVISRREVQSGLRNTLVVQARRLQYLAESRLEEGD